MSLLYIIRFFLYKQKKSYNIEEELNIQLKKNFTIFKRNKKNQK